MKVPTLSRPIRHLRRYQHIFTVFARHGFGFVLSQLPFDPSWLRKPLSEQPAPQPESFPAHFRQALEELGPAFIKLGQMLSTRPDVLPPAYIAELAKLQDAVPPAPWEEIEALFKQELGSPPDELFAYIDHEPIAAASLGQVYVVRLREGDKAVVKVQRPNILPIVQTDLEILQDLARYAEQYTPLGEIYHLVEITEDFANTLRNELDYQREGRNADRFRLNFANEPYLYIPKIYWQYSTKRVLVLEYISGIKIDDVAALRAAGHDCREFAAHAAQIIIKEVLIDGFFHADPHPGNLVAMEGSVIGAMDFGMVGYLSREDRANLVRLYTVAVRMDARGVVDELVHIGAASQEVNRRALTRDIDRLLNYYNGMPLKDIRVGNLLEDVMPIAFKYHLHFPTNLWLLGRALTIMEALGMKLDPDFDIFAFSAPYVTRLLIKTLLPNRHWIENAMRTGVLWGDLLDDLPRVMQLILSRVENREPLTLALDHPSLQMLDQLVTRLALSIIVAGMTIGLAFILPSTTESAWIVQAIVGLGFLVSLTMGAWVFISIVRRK